MIYLLPVWVLQVQPDLISASPSSVFLAMLIPLSTFNSSSSFRMASFSGRGMVCWMRGGGDESAADGKYVHRLAIVLEMTVSNQLMVIPDFLSFTFTTTIFFCSDMEKVLVCTLWRINLNWLKLNFILMYRIKVKCPIKRGGR